MPTSNRTNTLHFALKNAPKDSELDIKRAAFVNAYEELHDYLNENFPGPESEEWADDDADEAMANYRFWWTWGN